MARRILLIPVALLTLIVLAILAVPALAADPSGSTKQPAQGTQRVHKARVLIRLLTVQDKAKVDAFLAKAMVAGKLTQEQASKVEELWVNHHGHFAKGALLNRLLSVNDLGKVDAFLARAVQTGKLVQRQANKVKQLWQRVHGQFH